MKKVSCRRILTTMSAVIFFSLGLSGIVFPFSVDSDGVFLITPQWNPVPIKITTPGSYKLTGNITVLNANITAIQVMVNNVTIDLNGFSIIGPAVCTGVPTTCSPTGGSGIGITANTMRNIRVTNGTISGMGKHGIYITGDNIIIQGVRAISNGNTGIFVDIGTVSGSLANNNGNIGINVNRGTVNGNTTNNNGSNGIYVQIGTVSGNMSNDNGGSGIVVVMSGTVSGNTASFNEIFGLSLNSSVGYFNNGLDSNTLGNVNSGVNLGSNICNTALCP